MDSRTNKQDEYQKLAEEMEKLNKEIIAENAAILQSMKEQKFYNKYKTDAENLATLLDIKVEPMQSYDAWADDVKNSNQAAVESHRAEQVQYYGGYDANKDIEVKADYSKSAYEEKVVNPYKEDLKKVESKIQLKNNIKDENKVQRFKSGSEELKNKFNEIVLLEVASIIANETFWSERREGKLSTFTSLITFGMYTAHSNALPDSIDKYKTIINSKNDIDKKCSQLYVAAKSKSTEYKDRDKKPHQDLVSLNSAIINCLNPNLTLSEKQNELKTLISLKEKVYPAVATTKRYSGHDSF